MHGPDSQRVLIFVSAWNAGSTLRSVLDRIPETFVSRHRPEVLIIDDASSDDTFQTGLDWASQTSIPVRVLQNPRPHGYGGNLKLGFQYAIQEGFGIVVLLHGDGKYAPERLSAMVEPISSGQADVVIGSRFIGTGGRTSLEMPRHRILANLVTGAIQNALLRSSFTDFHSAYRAYSVATLEQIPFGYATDDLHIETEILVQLLRGKQRISEVAVPAYHGSDLGYRRGSMYALRSLRSTVAAVLDSLGVKYRRKFDLHPGPPGYSLKLGYTSSHSLAIDAVPRGARVIDIGCGRGWVARELRAKDCHVTGLDAQPAEEGCLSEFVRWDLDSERIPVRVADYDWLLLLDVIEHLKSPERFMERLRDEFEQKQPTILLTAPNTAFVVTRLGLLVGQLNYGREGILDFTHTRLFTSSTLRDLLEQVGYEILEVRGIPAPFPKALGYNWFSRLLVALNELLIRFSKTLFSYQLFFRLRPLPTVRTLLTATRTHTESKSRRLDG